MIYCFVALMCFVSYKLGRMASIGEHLIGMQLELRMDDTEFNKFLARCAALARKVHL